MAPGMDVAIEATLGRLKDGLQAYATGYEYLNFQENPTEASSFFAPDVLARLRAVRERVDPQRMFQANHQVG